MQKPNEWKYYKQNKWEKTRERRPKLIFVEESNETFAREKQEEKISMNGRNRNFPQWKALTEKLRIKIDFYICIEKASSKLTSSMSNNHKCALKQKKRKFDIISPSQSQKIRSLNIRRQDTGVSESQQYSHSEWDLL